MPLKDVIEAMQGDLRSHPENGMATFSADSHQVEGLRCETNIRHFNVTVDEPESIGGTDAGPNPVERISTALASCTIN
jgi:uncharacterized OsmC-like protein